MVDGWSWRRRGVLTLRAQGSGGREWEAGAADPGLKAASTGKVAGTCAWGKVREDDWTRRTWSARGGVPVPLLAQSAVGSYGKCEPSSRAQQLATKGPRAVRRKDLQLNAATGKVVKIQHE